MPQCQAYQMWSWCTENSPTAKGPRRSHAHSCPWKETHRPCSCLQILTQPCDLAPALFYVVRSQSCPPRDLVGSCSETWQEPHPSSRLETHLLSTDSTVDHEAAPWPSSSPAWLWSKKQSCPTGDPAGTTADCNPGNRPTNCGPSYNPTWLWSWK